MTLKNVLVNEYLQELTPHGTDAFPITVSHDDLTCFADRCIRCHWHDDLEIGLIRQGTVTYQAAEQVHTLIPGQAIVINSDVPHSAVPIKNSHVMIDTIIIQTAFLSETPGNDIDRNCLSPFFHNTDLPCIPLLLENEIQSYAESALSGGRKILDRRGFCSLRLQQPEPVCRCFSFQNGV